MSVRKEVVEKYIEGFRRSDHVARATSRARTGKLLAPLHRQVFAGLARHRVERAEPRRTG
ncbi:MAG: hypothetical protein ACRDWD_06065 [Acidimicrobiia bacterium]